MTPTPKTFRYRGFIIYLEPSIRIASESGTFSSLADAQTEIDQRLDKRVRPDMPPLPLPEPRKPVRPVTEAELPSDEPEDQEPDGPGQTKRPSRRL